MGVRKPEVVTTFEDIAYGSRMVLYPVDLNLGAAFAADMIEDPEKTLVCFWPCGMKPDEFKKVVEGCYRGKVNWQDGIHTLWGGMDERNRNGFALEVEPFPGAAPRASGLLELSMTSGRDRVRVLSTIARVASETVIEPGLLKPRLLRKDLRVFIARQRAA